MHHGMLMIKKTSVLNNMMTNKKGKQRNTQETKWGKYGFHLFKMMKMK